MKKKYVIALDAGTTSVRAFVYDIQKNLFVHGAQQDVCQSFPQSGWVEQDANEIYYKAAYALNDCIAFAGAENVAGIGIANQRETIVRANPPRLPSCGSAAARALFARRSNGTCASVSPP